MVIVIGEILIDCFPDYERIGGAPFNFAFHLKQMGRPVRFITRIGDDPQGRSISQMLDENGFSPADVQIDRHHPTGRVEVALDQAGIPQFDICKEVAYDHIDLPSITAQDKAAVDMFYFGSLVQRTANGRLQVQRLLADKPDSAKCFCDINLRPPHVDDDAVAACLHQTDIMKLNSEELEEISRRCGGPQTEEAAIAWMMQAYDIDTVAMTLGAQGSRVVTAQGQFTSPPADVAAIVDTVGAGDAYAAVLAAGLLHGLPMDRTLALATRFAADICALPGAIPDDKSIYTPLHDQMERTFHGH